MSGLRTAVGLALAVTAVLVTTNRWWHRKFHRTKRHTMCEYCEQEAGEV